MTKGESRCLVEVQVGDGGMLKRGAKRAGRVVAVDSSVVSRGCLTSKFADGEVASRRRRVTLRLGVSPLPYGCELTAARSADRVAARWRRVCDVDVLDDDH